MAGGRGEPGGGGGARGGKAACSRLAAGDGSVRFRDVLEAAGVRVAPAGSRAHVVRGLSICRLALDVPPAAPQAVLPQYLREPDAKPRTRPVNEPLEIRRLTYADLPQVIAIERRAFSTPWSLAMFVLELSKPTGICLAALRDGRVVGYLVCSRYDTVWHVMNVAVDDRLLRQGIATALMEQLFAEADGPGEQYTLEVRTSNGVGDPPVRAVRLPGRRPPPRLLPRQPRGRGDHVAHRARARGCRRRPGVILALETSCDDTCAAVVTAGGEVRSNAISSQGLLHARYGGVVPEMASRRHLELVDAVTADALERRGGDPRRHRVGGRDPRAGADRCAARGRVEREGAGGRAPAAAHAGRPPAWARGGLHARARADRAALRVSRGQRRPHLPRAGGRSRADTPFSARRWTTRRVRRSTRAHGCSACPTRAGPSWTGSRARGSRRRSASRGRCPATDSTSASPDSRPRSCTRFATLATARRAAEPTWPPPISARSWPR